MENLRKWEKFRNVPPEAKKAIGGGRLKGMTDINPVWRLKTLTEAEIKRNHEYLWQFAKEVQE